jgi:hypothetical protein
MKKITVFIFIQCLVCGNSHSQNIGIGNTNPAARLDISGDIAIRSADIIIATTVNTALNVNTTKQASYKLKSAAVPVGNFVIAGITGGADGRIISLHNRTGNSMEIYNNDAAALAANRVLTGTNSTLAVYNNGTVVLQYDATLLKWMVTGMHNNSLNYFGSGGSGSSPWDIAGVDIFNSNSGNVGIGINTPNRAKLEVNGISGSASTIAIFGGDATGVSIQRNWPTIGFNQYRDEATGFGKAIGDGYGAHLTLNPQLGYVQWVMQDSVAANASFVAQPKTALTLFKNSFVHIGNNGVTDQATLSISGSSNFPSHFNFGSDGHTYIRGGSRTYRNIGFFQNRPSKVYINDVAAEDIFTGTARPGGDVIIAAGGGKTGIGIDNDLPCKLNIYEPTIQANSNTHVLLLRGKNPVQFFNDEFNTTRGYIKGITDRAQTNQFVREGIEIGTGGGDIYLTALGYQPAITVNGSTNNVGIGINTPNEKLSVNGNIRSKEVVVELANWPDYVFDKAYILTPLTDLEKFIKANKHLPNIPSSTEIEANGLRVGDVQKRMMEKIEELTLYVIELKKQIDALKNK